MREPRIIARITTPTRATLAAFADVNLTKPFTGKGRGYLGDLQDGTAGQWPLPGKAPFLRRVAADLLHLGTGTLVERARFVMRECEILDGELKDALDEEIAEQERKETEALVAESARATEAARLVAWNALQAERVANLKGVRCEIKVRGPGSLDDADGWLVVKATVYDGIWAIHREIGRLLSGYPEDFKDYTVTHVGTGLRLGENGTLATARLIVARLLAEANSPLWKLTTAKEIRAGTAAWSLARWIVEAPRKPLPEGAWDQAEQDRLDANHRAERTATKGKRSRKVAHV